jgi:hypothetical protein
MIIEQALRAKLVADTALYALVGQRVYYIGKVPQDVTLPYLVYQTIDDIPVHSQDGFSKLSTARIQINSFDDSYIDCKAVDTAIFNAIDSEKGTWSGVVIGSCFKDKSGDFPNDDNPDISGIHTDYIIQYNP